jgi:CBS domain-containing protein
MIEIKKYMSKKIIFISRTDTIARAAKIMKINSVSCLLVKDKNNYVGIVTERDITEKCVATGMGPESAVEEIMSYPIYTADIDKDILGVAYIAQKKKIKKIPITKNNEIVGIITDTDLVRGFAEWMETINHEVERKKDSINYSDKAMALIKNFNKEYEATRIWHMACDRCNHKFFAEEQNGKIDIKNCPKCGYAKMHHIT